MPRACGGGVYRSQAHRSNTRTKKRGTVGAARGSGGKKERGRRGGAGSAGGERGREDGGRGSGITTAAGEQQQLPMQDAGTGNVRIKCQKIKIISSEFDLIINCRLPYHSSLLLAHSRPRTGRASRAEK